MRPRTPLPEARLHYAPRLVFIKDEQESPQVLDANDERLHFLEGTHVERPAVLPAEDHQGDILRQVLEGTLLHNAVVFQVAVRDVRQRESELHRVLHPPVHRGVEAGVQQHLDIVAVDLGLLSQTAAGFYLDALPEYQLVVV